MKRQPGVLVLDEFLAENSSSISRQSLEEHSFKEIYEIEEYLLQKQAKVHIIQPEHIFLEEKKLVPKKTQNRKPGNYKPKTVRGEGSMREGYCENCDEWFRLKTSSYWYHMNFKHGVSSNGRKYPDPIIYYKSNRPISDCPLCSMEVYLGTNARAIKYNWYKHFQKVHRDDYEKI